MSGNCFILLHCNPHGFLALFSIVFVSQRYSSELISSLVNLIKCSLPFQYFALRFSRTMFYVYQVYFCFHLLQICWYFSSLRNSFLTTYCPLSAPVQCILSFLWQYSTFSTDFSIGQLLWQYCGITSNPEFKTAFLCSYDCKLAGI